MPSTVDLRAGACEHARRRLALDGHPSRRRPCALRRPASPVTAAFEGAGFALEGLTRVEQPATLDLRGWRDQLPAQRRADTVLVGLTDAEFAAGMHRLDEAIADDESPAPIGLDLLWFR